MKGVSFIKVSISILIIFLAGWNIYAQEDSGSQGMAFGMGPEWNMNSRHNFAGGLVLGFDYNLPVSVPLAMGINVAGSYNFSYTVVLEAAPFLRWYFMGVGYTGFFVQADVGYYYAMEDLNKKDKNTFDRINGGLRAGYRLPMESSFYIEPYIRAGYPFVFGVGLMAGILF